MVHLPLSLLHESLFLALPENIHDAEKDAEITAKCYFEMIQRKDLSDQEILNQQTEFDNLF
jgi:DNA polymerase-3 subunit epsilon